ncbi:MAG: tyrosine recombinase XerC [Oscillospiraceae bacterium]|nr:tyrosine recombinase XerC [Oscillospiraceae bacterium]
MFQINALDDCPDILKRFLVYLQTIKGKSPKTVYEYFLDLRMFFRFLKKNRGLVLSDVNFDEITISDVGVDILKTVTLSEVYDFLYYVLNDRGDIASTRSRKSSALRTFFSYLTVKANILEVNPVAELEVPSQRKRLPKYLTLEECIQLLSAIEGKYAVRDYCITVLFLNCGIRLSELVGININDINGNNLRVVGKGDNERNIHLNQACLDAISEYMKVRPNNDAKDKQALFISRQGNRISTKVVQANMKKYLKMSGLEDKGYSVHKLRHTAATLMYQHGGVDLRILKEILGHQNLATTEIYTHIASEQIDKAFESNPLAKIKMNKSGN